MSNPWMAVSLLICKTGEIYGRVEAKGTLEEIRLYVWRHQGDKDATIQLPPHPTAKEPEFWMLYALELQGGMDFQVTITKSPSP